MNLVTGATGLVGTHVMLHLLTRGEQVVALKQHSSDLSGVKSVLDFSAPGQDLFERIRWLEGNVLDVTSLSEAMSGCQHVYHCAAVVSYHKDDRSRMYRVNVEGTANVVNASIGSNIRKLCHVSSIAALGKPGNNQHVDEQTVWKDSKHNTHYGITKHLAEMEVWRGVHEGLEAVVVNPGFILGPGNFMRSSGIIFPRIDQGIPFFPPGGTGFVGVNDVAEIMIRLMQRDTSGERFVLVSESLTMKEMFSEVSQKLGRTPPSQIASPFLLHSLRIAEWLKEVLGGKRALVTRESLRNASVRVFYSNEKIRTKLSYTFEPVSAVISHTCSYYQSRRHKED